MIEMWYHVIHKMHYAGVYSSALISTVLSQVVKQYTAKTEFLK